MNLLHISPNPFPELGVDHATKRIWEELSTGFNEYHIFARSKDNRFHESREGNIYLHLVPGFKKARSFIISSLYIFRILRLYKIDVMLSQCPILGGALATMISKNRKIPIMVEIHGMEYFRILDDSKLLSKLMAVLIRYSLKHATKVRSLSTKMTEMFATRGITKNIVLIPNRVNFNIFNKPKVSHVLHNPIRIISVGRFVWEKGYGNAIRAVLALQKKYDIELMLVGGGPLYRDYLEITNGYKGFTFHDWLSQDDLVQLLYESDIYIQPSLSEGMPRTILEAMSARLPIIASDVGAISGVIVNGENGMLIKGDTVSELERALESLIENNDLRQKIAKNGYSDAAMKYEWKKVFELYKGELIDMVQGKTD